MTNEELFDRAQRVIPGGVNSPVRAFKSVGGTPYFVARAEGAYVWDVEGTRYLDLVQSYGAIIHGHAHPVIVEAISDTHSLRAIIVSRLHGRTASLGGLSGPSIGGEESGNGET